MAPLHENSDVIDLGAPWRHWLRGTVLAIVRDVRNIRNDRIELRFKTDFEIWGDDMGGGVVESSEHEERFVLTRAQVTRFLSAIASRAALETYDRARPIAYTRTTYFDTDDLQYLQSCAGPVARRLRLREYAMAASLEDAPILSSVACLELKQNAGTARSKVRLQATPTLLRQLIEQRGQRDPAFASLEPLSALATLAHQLALPTMAPRLTTWYRRAAMTAESGRLRITLDERLTFCRPQSVGVVGAEVAPSPADVIAPGPPRILEIKHWGDRPLWLTWALDGLQPARDFSKFRLGMSEMTRRLQRSTQRYAAGGAEAEAEVEADADTDPTTAIDIDTYFAPTPGTA